MPLTCFIFLAIFQGLSNQLWQSTAYMAQHDIRMDATDSLVGMGAPYFGTRQTGNLMSVLSADVAQLEDIISDASTSMLRLVMTFATGYQYQAGKTSGGSRRARRGTPPSPLRPNKSALPPRGAAK
jgi:ATP-binding cassette subfamily B protein